jgi:hypothetical protein
MITCHDSFWYPTLTEGKMYERINSKYPDEVLIIDDVWHERRFPMQQFDIKLPQEWYDYKWEY